jgi:4-hydroxy-tetrahydrodipicolinate synthase
MTARFGAVLTAMATPFTADGALDVPGAATLARWLVDNGSDGLVVTGTTGESPTLSDEEKVALWRTVRGAVTVPVVAGATSNDTAHSVSLVRAATDAGVDGILAVAPYYSRPPQSGMDGHFRAVAAATPLPVLIYDIPIRTGRKVATDTLLRLAREVPNIAGVKDAAANPAATAELIAEAPAGFEVYSGDDSLTLPLLAVGAVGLIGVATHWSGPEHAELLAMWEKGDAAAARAINARLLESFAFETSELAPNPIPTKAMLRVLGLPAGQCRLPLGPAPEGLEERARQVLRNLGRTIA